MAVYNHWSGLDWIGLSPKSRTYRYTITGNLFVQCMRQDKWCLQSAAVH